VLSILTKSSAATASLLSGILIPAISRMLSFLARKLTASIFKPLLQRLVLLVGEGRVQMFDRDVGREINIDLACVSASKPYFP